MIVIQVHSAGHNAGNFAKVLINDAPVQPLPKNENGHHRGLHVVIIHPQTGKVEMAKVFDTYKSSSAFDGFITKGIPYGYIVVAAC